MTTTESYHLREHTLEQGEILKMVEGIASIQRIDDKYLMVQTRYPENIYFGDNNVDIETLYQQIVKLAESHGITDIYWRIKPVHSDSPNFPGELSRSIVIHLTFTVIVYIKLAQWLR